MFAVFREGIRQVMTTDRPVSCIGLLAQAVWLHTKHLVCINAQTQSPLQLCQAVLGDCDTFFFENVQILQPQALMSGQSDH